MGRAVELINAHAIDVTTMLAGFEPLEKLPEILASRELRAKGKYVILPNGEEGKGTKYYKCNFLATAIKIKKGEVF